jgi:hypothetical protein
VGRTVKHLSAKQGRSQEANGFNSRTLRHAEGTAEWLATGPENRGIVMSDGRSIRLPSAKFAQVELAARKSPKQHEPGCGLAVVLPGGRRIEVHPDFDPSTFERLVSALERV